MNYEPEFRASLKQDFEEGNTVKIDLRKAPWEITGRVSFVGEINFQLEGHPEYRMTDILYYRLA